MLRITDKIALEDWELTEQFIRASVVPKRRIATKPTLGSKRRRLQAKKERGEVKVLRGKVSGEE